MMSELEETLESLYCSIYSLLWRKHLSDLQQQIHDDSRYCPFFPYNQHRKLFSTEHVSDLPGSLILFYMRVW